MSHAHVQVFEWHTHTDSALTVLPFCLAKQFSEVAETQNSYYYQALKKWQTCYFPPSSSSPKQISFSLKFSFKVRCACVRFTSMFAYFKRNNWYVEIQINFPAKTIYAQNKFKTEHIHTYLHSRFIYKTVANSETIY